MAKTSCTALLASLDGIPSFFTNHDACANTSPAPHHTTPHHTMSQTVVGFHHQELVERDQPGYAIGGLAGGADKLLFIRVVAHTAPKLPAGKPRYVMGIGYPLDIVLCTALGADMYDSVFPMRTARMGTALVPGGALRLDMEQYRNDTR